MIRHGPDRAVERLLYASAAGAVSFLECEFHRECANRKIERLPAQAFTGPSLPLAVDRGRPPSRAGCLHRKACAVAAESPELAPTFRVSLLLRRIGPGCSRPRVGYWRKISSTG